MFEPALVTLERPLAQHEHELHAEQLVEREASPSLFLLAHVVGQVDAGECVAPRDHLVRGEDGSRDRVGDPAFRAATQGLLDPAGHLPGVDLGLLALRVDRHDATGPIADQVDDRVRHLQPAPIRVGLAEQRDLQALLQLPLPPRLIEEHHVHPPRAVTDIDVDHRAPVASRALVDRADGHEHERFLAGHEIRDPSLVRPIDPATRVGRDEVEQVGDPDFFERRLLLRTDALQPFDGNASPGPAT